MQAADSKNSGSQYKARNLSFKSSVFDVSLAMNYYLLSIKKHGFSPYISAGIGTMFFNPYANDVSGKKQYLRELSNNSYTAKPLLDARNPTTAKFTWLGNEVGGEAYPTNLKLPRGNPDNKDGFYTT